jgi:flagellar biosynthesis protein FlhF
MDKGNLWMKIKRFFAADMRQAIRQVRHEQGPEAVILSSRAVEGGIEIVSAMDYDQNLLSEMVQSAEKPLMASSRDGRMDYHGDAKVCANTSVRNSPVETAHTRVTLKAKQAACQDPAISPQVPIPHDPVLEELRRELTSMKGLLQDQLSELAWGNYSRTHPLRAQHIKRLEGLGFSPKLARAIAESVHEVRDSVKSWREVLYRVAKEIPIHQQDMMKHGGVVALVGATGVGKTTTIAKLAARFALRHGRNRVALVSTDSYRIGAQKQLQTYGQILSVPVLMTSRNELGSVLEGLADKKLVLIDSAGMSPRDLRVNSRITTINSNTPIKTYIALSANTQRTALDEVIRAFGLGGLDGCILTKLDEAVSLGDLVSVIIRHRLPVAYISDGQRVPEDLHPARVVDLVTRALSLSQKFRKAAAEETPTLPTLKRPTKEMTVNALV